MTSNDFPDANRYHYTGGSSKDVTVDTPLWRYITFEKFCWLLETSQLYHARLDQFDDPFEGAVTDVYAQMRDAGKIEPYFNQKEYEPWIFKTLRYRQFATCWYASPHESDALWKLYGPGGAGIAVVSTMRRLKESVDLAPYRQGLLGQVEYVDFSSHDMRQQKGGTVMRPGHLKRKSFEHEHEVRGIIIKELIHEGSTVSLDDASIERQRREQPLGINAKVDLKGLIQSIVASPTAKPFFHELVQLIAKRHDLNPLVVQSKLNGTPAY